MGAPEAPGRPALGVLRPAGLDHEAAGDRGRLGVAMLCASLSRASGGLAGAVVPLAALLAGQGATLVTLRPPEIDAGAPVLVPRRVGPLALDAAGLVELSEARIVHTHGLWTTMSLAAMRWRRRTGGPTIVSPHGMLEPWALARHGWRKRAVLRAVERAHMEGSACVHALNAAEALAIRALGIRTPIAIVPNGTATVDPVYSATLRRPGFMDRPTLLFLGRLHAKKGVSELIAAWAGAARNLPGWRLAIVGMDDGRNRFRAEARATAADIVFPGPLFDDGKASAYAHAAAFVLPSRSEGLPLTVLEAMAHGTPVLMTEACNVPEAFAARAAAALPAEPDEMARAIVERLSDAAWLAGAGVCGRSLVAERFAWDGIASTWSKIYAWVLGMGPRPPQVTCD